MIRDRRCGVGRTDVGGASREAFIGLHVTDGNDAPSLGNISFTSAESVARDTVVGTIVGRDEDAGQNASLVYSLIGGEADIQSDWFAVNSSTGAVS